MINREKIKNLSVAEKLQLIDDLWESMGTEEIETEEDAQLRERLEAYERGELTFVSWDEAKAKIEDRLKHMRSAK